MSSPISNNDGPLPAGNNSHTTKRKKHEKIIIKEKCYGRIDSIGDCPGPA